MESLSVVEMFTVTKTIEFDYGHRVPYHTSHCRNLHGHRAKIEVDVNGPLVPCGTNDSSEGMVVDFSVVKEAMMTEIHALFDHTLLLFCEDPLLASFVKYDPRLEDESQYARMTVLGPNLLLWIFGDPIGRVVQLPCVPTAENLAKICFELLSKKLNSVNLEVIRVRFWETPNSVASYTGGAGYLF